MVHLPHRNRKNSIWNESEFHLKIGKSQKTETVNKNRKKWKFEKKNFPRYCIEEYVYQIWCRLEDI